MDITKAQFLNKKQMPILKENIKAIVDKDMINKLKSEEYDAKIKEHEEQVLLYKTIIINYILIIFH